MIFILDIILGLNLLWAYKSFKNVISPPFLVGSGLFLASLVATSYYKGWKIDQLTPETVFIIGFGSLFFTLSCNSFKKQYIFDSNYGTNYNFDLQKFYMTRIKHLLIFLIIFGMFTCYYKIQEYIKFFGNNDLSELLFLRRLDEVNNENKFQLPLFLSICSKFLNGISYFIAWICSLLLLSNHKYKLNIILCIIVEILAILNGLADGNKGNGMALLMTYIIIFYYMLSIQKRKFVLNTKYFIIGIVSLFVFILLFDTFNESIGRQLDTKNKSNLFAIYIGAEIKNFDLYIQDQSDHFILGQESLEYVMPQLIEIHRKAVEVFQYQHIGTYELGNVYTMFYSYHLAFGIVGVFIITFIVSSIAMYFYNKTFSSLNNPYKINIYLLLYANCAILLFMSFFSARFSDVVFTFNFIAKVIILYIIKYFLTKFVLRRDIIKN